MITEDYDCTCPDPWDCPHCVYLCELCAEQRNEAEQRNGTGEEK